MNKSYGKASTDLPCAIQKANEGSLHTGRVSSKILERLAGWSPGIRHLAGSQLKCQLLSHCSCSPAVCSAPTGTLHPYLSTWQVLQQPEQPSATPWCQCLLQAPTSSPDGQSPLQRKCHRPTPRANSSLMTLSHHLRRPPFIFVL